MSLLIWLPLNGNTKNQGLYNIDFSASSGATVNSAGKIGSCYSLNGSNGYVETGAHDKTIWNNKEITFAIWFKSDQSRTSGVLIEIGADLTLNYTYNSSGIRFGFWRSYLNSSNTRTGDSNTGSTYYDASKWHHIAITFAGAFNKLYVDGELSQIWDSSSKYTTNFSPILPSTSYNRISIGCTRGSTNYSGGLINDARIYDNALDPAQIKLISQGLVLHYPLNRNGFGQENLATNTAFPESNIQGYCGQKAVLYNHSDWTSGGRFFSSYGNSRLTFTEIQANQPYTMSAWVYIYDDVVLSHPSGTSIFYRIYKTGDSPTYSYDIYIDLTGITERNKWIKISKTFISPYTYTYNQGGSFQIGGYNGHFLVSMPKVELGSIATPWCPNSSDALADKLGLNNSIEYDVSGYGNNGMKTLADGSTGSFIYTSTTPKYWSALNIHSLNTNSSAQAGTAYINGSCVLVNPNQITVSFWLNAKAEGYGGNNTGQGAFCLTNNSIGTDYLQGTMNHRDNAIDVNSADGNSHLRLGVLFTSNEWHLYTFTYDGQNARSYKDGILYDTKSFASATSLGSFANVFIGLSRAGSVWRRNNHTYSDFRIYTTCFSADDIKKLYDTPVQLTSNGALLTSGELTEG